MNTKAIIVLVSSVLIGIICIKNTSRIKTGLVDIDYIEALSAEVKKHSPASKTIYYLSNNKSDELYYKTQFAFAPYVLPRVVYAEIPSGSVMLVATYAYNNEPNSDYNNISPDCTVLYSSGNEFVKNYLIQKK